MTRTLPILFFILAFIGLGIFIFLHPSAPVSSPMSTATSTAESAPSIEPQLHIVNIIANGFSPQTTMAHVGDTVEFINTDSIPHWPASDPHPQHTICPDLGVFGILKTNESYSFRIRALKDCPFHDHDNPSIHGIIVVQ